MRFQADMGRSRSGDYARQLSSSETQPSEPAGQDRHPPTRPDAAKGITNQGGTIAFEARPGCITIIAAASRSEACMAGRG